MSPLQLNLWSLTLLPNEPVPVFVRRDFQITNAALGEELVSADGRSVVKVTHSPIPVNFDDSDDEYEYDSDMVVGSDEEDEEEAAAAMEDEDESEEAAEGVEGDSEDESDDEEDMLENAEESVLCALTAGKIEQAQLNLTFIQGEVVIFQVTGENAVHLMGNYIYQGGESDSESNSDYDEEDFSDLDDEDEFSVEEFDEEIEVAPKGKITEVAEEKAKPATPKTFASVVADKKRKADEIETASPAKADGELTKTQKKKLAKKAKLDAAETASPAPKEAKKEVKETPKKETPKKETPKKEESKKKTLPSGLIIEDMKVGTGPVAKGGKRLGMRYIGKLENGKQFDANTGGKPFNFVLGRGEVISGWDQGLVGMAVGGERRLTIPAKLAYGSQKIPGIPPNSTLKFDVKLVSVN